MRRYGFGYPRAHELWDRGTYGDPRTWSAYGYPDYPPRQPYGAGPVRSPEFGGGPDWFGTSRDWRTGEPWGTGPSNVNRVCVRDIMTEGPEAVTRDTSLADVAKRMRDLDIGIVPVVSDLEGYHLEGVITDRDIAVRAVAEGKNMEKAKVREYMSSDVATVGSGASVRDVFTVMKRERVRRVPVTDESGRLIGIIAQADLAVDYAGLDVDRELEVEEVVERISEPARPRYEASRRRDSSYPEPSPWTFGRNYDRDLADRFRHGWSSLKREARDLIDRRPDRGWR
ncbi:MAG: CBS domain-containing protein [Gemmatimonas sp.]|nr:CBS domain-containing protein [Gemmatimonas sp.]